MSERLANSFGELLHRLRLSAGLTQEELAVAAGVSSRAVSDIERGLNRTAHRDTAQRLALALGLAGAATQEFVAVARGHSAWAAGQGAEEAGGGILEKLASAEPKPVQFGQVLKQRPLAAGMTQEELAAASGVSLRQVSDLERGINPTARRETARLLADALGLKGPERMAFEAAARGRALDAGTAAAATRTLPRDLASFTGRETELAHLSGAVRAGDTAGIYVVNGMAGVGKTAFAVHAAYELAPLFPDGQLFVSLHAHTSGRRPADPADALASLLRLPASIPGTSPQDLKNAAACGAATRPAVALAAPG